MAKRSRARKRRAEESSNTKTPLVIIGSVIGVLVLAGLGYLVWDASRPVEEIEGLVTLPAAPGNEHVQGEFLAYEEVPQAGGPHNPFWQNCGIYEAPVRPEPTIHSLEHGAVWVTYQPGLPEDQVQQLQDLVWDESFVVLSPYPNQRSPIFLTSWAYQLELDTADDERITAFLDRYIQDPATTPELGASCAGGVGSPINR